jgi:hypothetical protein
MKTRSSTGEVSTTSSTSASNADGSAGEPDQVIAKGVDSSVDTDADAVGCGKKRPQSSKGHGEKKGSGKRQKPSGVGSKSALAQSCEQAMKALDDDSWGSERVNPATAQPQKQYLLAAFAAQKNDKYCDESLESHTEEAERALEKNDEVKNDEVKNDKVDTTGTGVGDEALKEHCDESLESHTEEAERALILSELQTRLVWSRMAELRDLKSKLGEVQTALRKVEDSVERDVYATAQMIKQFDLPEQHYPVVFSKFLRDTISYFEP